MAFSNVPEVSIIRLENVRESRRKRGGALRNSALAGMVSGGRPPAFVLQPIRLMGASRENSRSVGINARPMSAIAGGHSGRF